MSVIKVIELIGESDKSWEDATRGCVEDASKTLENIRSVWVKDMQAIVDPVQGLRFRVNCKLSFLVDENRRHT